VEVLGDGRPADGELASDLAHRPGPSTDQLEDRPARRFPQGVEYVGGGVLVNHDLP
jgi:hypothetical protein